MAKTPAYSVNDIVTLSSARGGWEGVISARSFTTNWIYMVHYRSWSPKESPGVWVLEQDIDAQINETLSLQAGDTVQIFGVQGEVVAANDPEYKIRISERRSKNLEFVNDFIVQKWQILRENTGE